jgi:hypothetical protein
MSVCLPHPSQKLVVRFVRTDPAPSKNITFAVANGSMGSPDTHRPNIPNLLQVERGMEWILSEYFELLVS